MVDVYEEVDSVDSYQPLYLSKEDQVVNATVRDPTPQTVATRSAFMENAHASLCAWLYAWLYA